MASQTAKDTTPAPIRLTNVELGRAMGRACDAWQDERERYKTPKGRKSRIPRPVRIVIATVVTIPLLFVALAILGQVGFGLTIENGHADAYLEGRNPVSGLTHGYRWCSDPESAQARADVPPER
jgi:hypothetical protein